MSYKNLIGMAFTVTAISAYLHNFHFLVVLAFIVVLHAHALAWYGHARFKFTSVLFLSLTTLVSGAVIGVGVWALSLLLHKTLGWGVVPMWLGGCLAFYLMLSTQTDIRAKYETTKS